MHTQAVEELSVRWEKAIGILLAADTPQWKKTRQAIWCFQPTFLTLFS